MTETCRVNYDNKLNCCIKLVPLVIKTDIETAPTRFSAVTPSSESALIRAAKVTVVKIVH